MEETMKSLSFIIPVYNGEKYISRCLKSVFSQDYPYLEIIIIDDGSSDNSVEIIKKSILLYNKKNYNTIIISQKNAGVSQARNKGINVSTSDYIAFLDQDDYILPNFCKKFMSEVKSIPYDMVIGGFIRKNKNNKTTRIMKANNSDWSKFCLTYPWARIIRRAFLISNNILFKNTTIGEDIYFDLISYSHTKNIKMIPDCLYVWNNNPQSVSNTKYTTINKSVNPIETFNLILNDFNKPNTIPDDYIEYYFIKFIVWFLLTNARKSTKQDIIKTRDKLFHWLEINFPNYSCNKNLSLFLPKGDIVRNKLAVFIYMKLKHFKIDTLIFSILSK